MRTIIAGSRRLHDPHDPTDETLIRLVAAAVAAAGWPISLVISGLARGPDQAAVRWAEIQGIPVQAMRPDWRPGGRYDRGAGLKRNTAMAAAADALIVLYDGQSPGTADMLTKARARGLAICAVRVDPTTRAVLAVTHSNDGLQGDTECNSSA